MPTTTTTTITITTLKLETVGPLPLQASEMHEKVHQDDKAV